MLVGDAVNMVAGGKILGRMAREARGRMGGYSVGADWDVCSEPGSKAAIYHVVQFAERRGQGGCYNAGTMDDEKRRL
jgi:hypothetical protein